MFHSHSFVKTDLPSTLVDSYRGFKDTDITVTYPTGEKKQFPQPCLVETMIAASPMPTKDVPIVGALVNNQLRGLDEGVRINVHSLFPVYLDTTLGSTIYRRSLAFLLAMASHRAFPERRLVVGHSLGDAIYYEFQEPSAEPLTDEHLAKLSEEMKSIVSAGHRIARRLISWSEAVDHFSACRQEQTMMLVAQHNNPVVQISVCDSYLDLYHGAHLPSSSLLTVFELRKYGTENGFLLRFPSTSSPFVLPAFKDIPKIYEAYKESKYRGSVLGVKCVGDLNRLVRRAVQGDLQKFVLVSEALHDRMIVRIAQAAVESPLSKLVLIAGPSSSGKTTFARKLTIQLQVLGKEPLCISLDDFYVDRERTPRDESGDYDYEAVEALDLPYLNELLAKLTKGERVTLPRYDFKSGTRREGKSIQLGPNGMLVIEGIHGLNDRLTAMIPAEQKFKVFISALTQLNLDDHTRIQTTDNRLIRRMVRDFQFRGTSGEDTLLRWPSVRAGEEKHIFPHQCNANIVFNSALDYELAALKVIAEPLLRNIRPKTSVYHEALRLMSFIENFDPIPHKYIPDCSILREFIGDSPYHQEEH